MPYPPKPQIQTSYTAVEQALGDGTLPGQEMDNDFANVVAALSALNDFVRGVTRSDGRLGNGTVTRDTLAADILLGVAPPEPWQTGRAYASPDTVFESNRFYVALTDHTSTDFASDLAAGRWLLLADFATAQAAAVAAQAAAVAAQAAAEAARDDVLERYLGPFAVEPTTAPGGAPLLAGMLYFNTVLHTMFVYSGSAWGSVSSAVSGVRNQFRYTATAGQTVFTGADATGATPVFGSANLVTVYRNGVRLVPTVDFTVNVALSSVTLAVGAALNDVLVVEVFGNFQAQPPEAAQVSQITVGGATFTGAATQGEAETGTATDRLMTPLRTAQAISALRPLPLAVGQGGTGATTAAAARTALGAAAASDLPPALTQGQVQNAGDTTQGTVSGQRLAQASQSLANGAAGWPRITPAALDRGYVQVGGGLGHGNQISLGWDGVGFVAAVDGIFQGTIHTSSLGWADFGTYAILHNNSHNNIARGAVVPGSQLRLGSGFETAVLSSTAAVNFGSWRAMMDVRGIQGDTLFPGLFLRVS